MRRESWEVTGEVMVETRRRTKEAKRRKVPCKHC